MSWEKALPEHKVYHHRTSAQEIGELRRVIARDIADAHIPALSENRRFAIAYNAAFQAAKMANRLRGLPHHQYFLVQYLTRRRGIRSFHVTFGLMVYVAFRNVDPQETRQ